MVDVTLAKVLCLFFYPVLFILRVAELLVTWTVQRFMPDATNARYCMYLCRLSNKVSFRWLLYVSFHQSSRGFETDKSGLHRHVDEDVVGTEFLICACKCATYFCRLL
jgi:hypothetical protein